MAAQASAARAWGRADPGPGAAWRADGTGPPSQAKPWRRWPAPRTAVRQATYRTTIQYRAESLAMNSKGAPERAAGVPGSGWPQVSDWRKRALDLGLCQ